MGTVRSNTKRAAVMVMVLVVLFCVALFVRAYQSAAPPDTQGQGGHGSTGTPSPSRAGPPSVDAVLPSRLPPATYTISPAVQPGFAFAGPPTHTCRPYGPRVLL